MPIRRSQALIFPAPDFVFCAKACICPERHQPKLGWGWRGPFPTFVASSLGVTLSEADNPNGGPGDLQLLHKCISSNLADVITIIEGGDR